MLGGMGLTGWPSAAVANTIDPILIAAKCRNYAQQYPDRQLPDVCAATGEKPSEAPRQTPTQAPQPTVRPGDGGSSPTPTARPENLSQTGQPYASAPACADHDRRKFHGLWNELSDCHYDHHHGDNPHELDGVLGTEVFTKMGGEISYPWQTFSADGYENDLKHGGYFWHVRKDIPCPGSEPCISNFRVLVHQHPTGLDATVRYHSYVFEASTSDNGYILIGGWADFGDLHSPEGHIVTDVVGNSDSRAGRGPGRHKQHSNTNPGIIWYGASQIKVDENYPRGLVTVSSTIHDAWDRTDPANPARADDYFCYGIISAARCRINATVLRPHLISINMVRDFRDSLDPDGDGRANFNGYADRYGRPLTGSTSCSGYSADCSPLIIRNLRMGFNYPANNSHTAQSFRDYDIYFNGLSSGWNQPVR